MADDIDTRKRAFSRLFRMCTPWATAEMLGEVIGDVDFRKSSTNEMAEAYAYGRYGLGEKTLQELGHAARTAVTAHGEMRTGEKLQQRQRRPRMCPIHNGEMALYGRGTSGSATRYRHEPPAGARVEGGEGAMTSQQQTAYQHPCRHPLEMASSRYQRTRVLDRVQYSVTITVQWGGGNFPRHPVWHAYVTVLGPLGSRRLQDVSAAVRQQARQLAGHALADVGMKTQQVVETDSGVHVYAPFTEDECTGLPAGWREAMQRKSPHRATEMLDATQMHQVDLRYTREELEVFFRVSSQEHLYRGGRYDRPGSAITVWSHPWRNEAMRLQSTPLGALYVRWGEENRIYQIACEEGCGLDALLHELAILEEKALGRVKHGKRLLQTALKEEAREHDNPQR